MDSKKIERINELAKKKKTIGLTEEELLALKEYLVLEKEYDILIKSGKPVD